MTDYHNLNTPEEGAADWHLPLNENFQTIDKKIEIRDEAGARSDYPPKAGAKYFATDTGAQWIGDGDEWHRLASTGDSPEFNSISHRDPSGQVLKRRCLLAGPPDEGPISIPAPDEYSVYHIRLTFAGIDARISFNDPPGDTLARRDLIDSNYIPVDEEGEPITRVSPFEIYVTERDDRADFNRVSVLGPVSNRFELGNNAIDRIYIDGGAEHAEAWGMNSKDTD
jgi:hypothetical protein